MAPVTRRDVEQYGHEMLASNVPAFRRIRRKVEVEGTRESIWFDPDRLEAANATRRVFDQWLGLRSGVRFGGWHVQLDAGPQPRPHWPARLFSKRLRANTSSESDLLRLIENIRKLRPEVLLADGQSALQFARYCQGEALTDVCFRSVAIPAGAFSAEQKAFIESVFDARLFERYGIPGLPIIASECEQRSGMHVDADHLVVEVIPDGRGSMKRRLLITDIANRAMPLIRYELGHFAATIDAAPCACGRSSPRLHLIPAARIAEPVDRKPPSRIDLQRSLESMVGTPALYPSSHAGDVGNATPAMWTDRSLLRSAGDARTEAPSESPDAQWIAELKRALLAKVVH